MTKRESRVFLSTDPIALSRFALASEWIDSWFRHGSQGGPVTRICLLAMDKLQRHNYSANTVRNDIQAIEGFASYFRISVLRDGAHYQIHLFNGAVVRKNDRSRRSS